MVQFDAKLRLPTALELPESDDTPVDNELQDTVPGLLKDTLRLIWQNRNDWFFGVDMGIYADTEQPYRAIVPDGFLSIGVPRFKPQYGDRGRPSYVLWEEEGKVPMLVLEVVSETYRNEYSEKLKEYQDLEVLYYVVYNPDQLKKDHAPLEVYRLSEGQYVLMTGEPCWMPEIGLGIGRAMNNHLDWRREWLYWFSEDGTRYPIPEEFQRYRADLAEQEVEQAAQREEQERQRANQAEQQAQVEREARLQAEARVQQERQRAALLAERLRALGLDPENL
ncbi:MAG: Uma2 family endonuclease [Anaerolineae bacterium]|nr:Uma2 family endonuclease [Gloeobacterales cyanobacterium ES-bin-313]